MSCHDVAAMLNSLGSFLGPRQVAFSLFLYEWKVLLWSNHIIPLNKATLPCSVLLASPIHQCHCYSWRLCLLFPPDCKICKYWITVVAYHYMTRHTVAQWLRTPAHRFPEFWFTNSFAGFQRPCPYGFSQTESRLNCIALGVPRLFTWDSMTCHWSFPSSSKLDWHPAQCPRKQSQRSKASVETGCRTHIPCLRISESYGTIRLNDVHSGMRGAVE